MSGKLHKTPEEAYPDTVVRKGVQRAIEEAALAEELFDEEELELAAAQLRREETCKD